MRYRLVRRLVLTSGKDHEDSRQTYSDQHFSIPTDKSMRKNRMPHPPTTLLKGTRLAQIGTLSVRRRRPPSNACGGTETGSP